jgi:hypothetical protein
MADSNDIIKNEKRSSSGGYTIPERSAHLAHGIEWLLKMGFLDSPDAQTALTANIYAVSEKIEEVSLVADTERQKLLVHLKLRPPQFHNKILSFVKKCLFIKSTELTPQDIAELVLERLMQVLSEYEIRVTFDEEIYQKSRILAEKISKMRVDGRPRGGGKS